MCIYRIQAQCISNFSEVVADDIVGTEMAIEEAMGHVLLKLFDGGMVEDVTLRGMPGLSFKRHVYLLQIRVQCPCRYCSFLPGEQEQLREEMRRSANRILKELFTSVDVKIITMQPASWPPDDCYVRSV